MLAARLLVGVGVGGFWAIAGGLAVRLVAAHQVGRATALVFGGVSRRLRARRTRRHPAR
ncbi:hypothetical protein [Streptomyces sp. NRRL F-2580]|uniref:hypothetical protein n=1 Tax=Streptomyces sp. NRRL F-2580 TaxID=1463841 RepID=UPI001F348623|nr:hypothetical protein [Streptomyces sp. NRRL F-2580]